MFLVQSRLSARLGAEIPADAPTAFLIDIQPDQWPDVRSILEEEGAMGVESVPVVMARMARIDGRGIEELAQAGRSGGPAAPEAEGRSDSDRERSRRWALTREQRLTYLAELPADNTLVAGELWSDPEAAEVSVEQDYARSLGVGVGSTLSLDIQGVPVELRVTSLREVDWGTFGINFFLVVEPGILDQAPQQRLAVARLSPDREQATQDLLAARFPNVTFLPVQQVLERIVAVLDRIGFGVSFLGGFTVVAGVLILGGAVSAGSARRGREVALLKTLGMTRREVASVFAVEYALVGAVAGAIGAVGGGVLAWAVLTRGMEIAWRFEAFPYLLAVAASTTLAVGAGLAASWRDLGRKPLETLRHGS
jgi:putative ABC transport system permease protein